MGMSIPFSIENRIKMDQKKYDIYKHIFYRSAALLTMGLFHMNMEMYNNDLSILSKPVFVIISTTAFFMIWNNKNKKQTFAIIILFRNFYSSDYVFYIYRKGLQWRYYRLRYPLVGYIGFNRLDICYCCTRILNF